MDCNRQLRVLEIMGSLHRGGAETMIMNYFRAMDRSMCQLDFVIHATFEGDYCKEAKDLGAEIFELPRPGSVGPFKYIKVLSEQMKRSGPYDAVHVHTNYQAFLSIIAAKIAGVSNIVVHSHSASFQTINRIFVSFGRLIMKFVPVKKVACGQAAGKSMFGSYDFRILRNAVDFSAFRNVDKELCAIKKRQLFGEKKVIGHLARLSKQKNHDFILDVAEALLEKRDDFVFALFGEGEEERRLKEEVKKRKLEEVVRFMGVTTDVASTYSLFDVFVLPSLWEGLPVTLVECQAAGLQALVSESVTKECDLGIGLLSYVPLSVETWVRELDSRLSDGAFRAVISDEKLSDYDVDCQWPKLIALYGEKEDS